MINRKLNKTVGEFYRRGLIDETFIMEAVSKTLGGSCEKSSSKEDIEDHIDFWWDSPKKGRIPMDAKGIKKNSRSDKSFDDSIHWLELQNVNGKPGWLYGKAEYIAFRTNTRIIFVKREKLLSFAAALPDFSAQPPVFSVKVYFCFYRNPQSPRKGSGSCLSAHSLPCKAAHHRATAYTSALQLRRAV